MAQLGEPTPKDWVSQVLEDLEELEISFELDQIEVMKKEKFKLTIKEAMRVHKNLVCTKIDFILG